jgi:hypothetical protein
MLSMPRIVRPDPSGVVQSEVGSPVEPVTHRSTKQNKELAEASGQEFLASSKSGCPIYSFRGRTFRLVTLLPQTTPHWPTARLFARGAE